MGTCSNLFSKVEFKVNSKTLQRVEAYLPQIDCLKTRMDKSQDWLNSVGAVSDNWNEPLSDRVREVSADGKLEAKKQSIGMFSLTDNAGLRLLSGVTQLAYDGTTGRILFSGGTVPNISQMFKVGDIIKLESPASGPVQFTVCDLLSATELFVGGFVTNTIIASPILPMKLVVERYEDSRRVGSVELLYQPPLSIFRNYDGGLPNGDFELMLTPENASTYKKRVIESLNLDRTPGVDYQFEIVDMYFYMCSVRRLDGAPAMDETFYLPLDNIDLRLEDLPQTGNSLVSRFIDVSPSTYAISVAVQDNRAGVVTNLSASRLATEGRLEKHINRLYIDYAGQVIPSPQAEPSYKPPVGDQLADYTTARYVETLINTGSYYKESPESFDDWNNRGQYNYFPFVKDSNNKSTRAGIYVGFDQATPNSRLLMFSHSKAVAEVVIRNGRVVDVLVQNC